MVDIEVVEVVSVEGEEVEGDTKNDTIGMLQPIINVAAAIARTFASALARIGHDGKVHLQASVEASERSAMLFSIRESARLESRLRDSRGNRKKLAITAVLKRRRNRGLI
jgi:hypothetical protein